MSPKMSEKFQMEKLLTEHIKKFHKKVAYVGQSESIKRVNSTSPGEGKKSKKIFKEKTEVEKLLGEYQKYKKESEKRYNDLKEENLKLRVENDKLLTEKAIAESKQEAEANIKKTKEKTAKPKTTEDDISECIDQLSSMKLIQMKAMGGQRTSPAEQAEVRKRQAALRPLFPCHLCEFGTDSQSVWDKHLKDEHRNVFNCPFCAHTFSELTLVKNHIYSNHKENKTPQNTIQKVKPCAFFNQKNGCKKKDQCDFSHEVSAHDQGSYKVPKLCWNGPWCRWKPSCRYVHTEDGEVIPPRKERLGFGRVDWSQPPPGYPVSSGRQTTQQVPDLRNMGQFPGIKMTMNVTEVWV